MTQTSRKARAGKGSIAPLPVVFARKSDPADARDRDWTVKVAEHGGHTVLGAREMHVPMDDSPASLAIRQHEMLHVALSPHATGKLDQAMLAAEDGRIETLATQQGIERERVMTDERLAMAAFNASRDPYDLACFAVAAVGSPVESTVRDILSEVSPDHLALMDLAHETYVSDPSFASTEAVAAMIRDLRDTGQAGSDGSGEAKPGEGKPEEGKPQPSQSGQHGLMPVPSPSASESEDSDEDSDEGGYAGEVESGRENARDGITPFDPGEYFESESAGGPRAGTRWAEPRLETPKRSVRVVKPGKGKGKASDTGIVPTRLARLSTDGKVFTSKRRRKTGAVLLDLSGSTGYVRNIVEDLVKQIPAAVVAGYWGNSHYDEEGNMITPPGTLRVLAANGKMVASDDLIPDGAGNEIDGPAVAWLAKQKGPRVWVFDGMATSRGDDMVSPAMQREIDGLVKRGRIKIVNPRESAGWGGRRLEEITREITTHLR